jgi:hypothetical protein
MHGLFRVIVYGWSELTRRLWNYPDLVDKHFGIYVLRQVRDDVSALPNAVADRVAEKLQKASLNANAAEQAPSKQPGLLNDKLADALERDFANRYQVALQRSMYFELHKTNEFAPLAAEVLAEAGASLSPDLRRTILFRAARSAAIHGGLAEARRLLAAGQAAPGFVADGPARARITVASGHADEAIQTLRDAADDESRSVLLNILAVERGDDAALRWFTEIGLSVDQLTPFGILNLCQLHLRRDDLAAVGQV